MIITIIYVCCIGDVIERVMTNDIDGFPKSDLAVRVIGVEEGL